MRPSRRAFLALRRPLQHPSRPKMFFMHVPKCGGTSIDRAIRVCYGRRSVLNLDSRASAQAAELLGKDLDDHREQLLLYFMSKKNLRYISGHFPYSETAFRAYGDQWDFVTVLRHPVSRWFSLYFFNKHKRHDHFRIEEDLETFVGSEQAVRLGQSYVNRFSSYGFGPMAASREAIDEAIANLDKFRLVGLLEELDTFLEQFEEVYGVKVRIGHENKNPLSRSRQKEQISEEIRRKVEEICRPDLEVYEHARSRLHRPVRPAP